MNAASSAFFQQVPNDPIQVLHYTLPNGLQLFLSVNPEQPRVYTEIAVRVGSKHDPPQTTGLAHYFEHMMFKGTDRMGTLDWKQEQVILDQIEQLFEEHRAEQDHENKKAIYSRIDQLSSEAARFAAANEYDKLVSAMGAKGTNAYTWVEQTVYLNDVPSNELERWFKLESERFRRPVLRLFHTELETVFEEYNISQDADFRKSLRTQQATLTPTHPYGLQTTLGRGEDLKNPSQTNIYRFFDTYYVPNNMAMILCGDFDPLSVVALAQQYFGHFAAKPKPAFDPPPQPPLQSRVLREVYGNEAPWVDLAWRFPGANAPEALLLPLISEMLFNQQAGLIDLNLLQEQQVLEAYAYHRIHEDYSSLVLHGKPRSGQTMEQVEALLLEQIQKLADGDFPAWLPEAAVRNLRLQEMKTFEKNQGRAALITSSYVLGIPWSDMVGRWTYLEQMDAKDVAKFAGEHLRMDNFVAVYKHMGPDPDVMKVEKPPITPIEVNREDSSAFARDFLQEQAPEVQPSFVDFRKAFQHASLGKGQKKLKAVQEKENGLFRLFFTFDMGKASDPHLRIATKYLPYLGTDRYEPKALQEAFFRLGVQFHATCEEDCVYLSLTGLADAYQEAVELLYHVMRHTKSNQEALDNLVADILKQRENIRQDRKAILQHAMGSYAHYGPRSPFTFQLSEDALRQLRPETLTNLLCSLLDYQHEVFYTGPLSARKAAGALRPFTAEHKLLPPLPRRRFAEQQMRSNKVLFVHFPTVQVELLLLSKGTPKFNLEEFILSEWYNHYFGYGLSSIVFQEIRESKALAYAAYAFASNPDKRNKAHYLRAYVGTQPDKLHEAVRAFRSILEHMPVSEPQMDFARQSIVKQLAADRLSRADLYWAWRLIQDRGFKHDLRADRYAAMGGAIPDQLKAYHQRYIKNRKYTWLVLGDRERVDFKYLRSIGKVRELTLEEIFDFRED
jgi:predicted Zn-dependent peptidase